MGNRNRRPDDFDRESLTQNRWSEQQLSQPRFAGEIAYGDPRLNMPDLSPVGIEAMGQGHPINPGFDPAESLRHPRSLRDLMSVTTPSSRPFNNMTALTMPEDFPNVRDLGDYPLTGANRPFNNPNYISGNSGRDWRKEKEFKKKEKEFRKKELKELMRERPSHPRSSYRPNPKDFS